MRFQGAWTAVFILWLAAAGGVPAQEAQVDRHGTNAGPSSMAWRSPAKLHKTLGKTKGEIAIDEEGIRFKAKEGPASNWRFEDIQTFSLEPNSLVIKTYKNRAHHIPGVQRFHFELTESVPAEVAAALAQGVPRPSENGIPNPAVPSVAEIPVHHRTKTGGTNGMLRFREEGIDYVTSSRGDSRSWRWADLEILSGLSPYTLFLSGYRETYTFDLKEPVPHSVLDRATNAIVLYAEGQRSGDAVLSHCQKPEMIECHRQ